MPQPGDFPASAEAQKLEALYDLYTKNLYIYLQTCFDLSPQDAEDVVHTAFCRVVPHLAQLGPPESSTTYRYLCITARNCAVDLLQKQSRAQLLPDDQLDQLPAPPLPDAVLDDLTMQRLLGYVRQLSPPLYQVFMLHYQEGLPPAKIAALLGITPQAAATRLHRARRQLQQRILQEEDEP